MSSSGVSGILASSFSVFIGGVGSLLEQFSLTLFISDLILFSHENRPWSSFEAISGFSSRTDSFVPIFGTPLSPDSSQQ